MFKVKEAREILFKNLHLLETETKIISETSGYISAEDINSPVDLPLFDQSAMDGFAVNFEKGFPKHKYKKIPFLLTGEIKAGDKPKKKLERNTAVYIYTGAAVPLNTTCVVMQEKTVVRNGIVEIPAEALKKGSNIRYKGSQTKKGELSLKIGSLLNPASAGFLSSMGITRLKVIMKPVVSVLSTGNELKIAGSELTAGKIYESNSVMLKAALNQCGIKTRFVLKSDDNKWKLSKRVEKMLSSSDVVIISGGISVGKYDLVKEILESHNVKELFYKVSQKPGKPLYAGKLKNKLIFALPGNPAASLVCFYEYVLPSLRKMSGHSDFELRKEYLPLEKGYQVKGGRDLFLKAKTKNGKVVLLEGQGSDILRTFAEANALVYLSSGDRIIRKGSLVETHLLPI